MILVPLQGLQKNFACPGLPFVSWPENKKTADASVYTARVNWLCNILTEQIH